ncbi:ATP/GTP-binding protein, partial [Streptomyces sp. YC537]|nr:ATP/GTP-binding protein [Streptomyces boluensis]
MDRDGTHEAHDGRHTPAPPTTAPAVPDGPPMPRQPPQSARSASASVADWLATPRPKAAPGIWRFGHRPRGPEQDDRELKRRLIRGLVIPTLLGLVLWSMLQNGSLPYLWMPVKVFTPAEWWHEGTISSVGWQGENALIVYGGVVFGLVVHAVVRLSTWREAAQYFVMRRPQPSRALIAAVAALLVLALVWPSAFGAGWDPVPVVTPVLSLIALTAGSYSVFASTPVVTYAAYTLITLAVLWPFARMGGWWALLRGLGRTGQDRQGRPAPPRPST